MRKHTCGILKDLTPALRVVLNNLATAFPDSRGGRRFRAGTTLLHPHFPRQYMLVRGSEFAPNEVEVLLLTK